MNTTAVDTRFDALRATGECREECLAELARFLREAPDEQLYRMSPRRFAVEHDLSETEAIELFLRATHAGILEISWGLNCPGCLAFLTTRGGLRALDAERWCNLCRIQVQGLLDDNVEVTFTVTPTVRRIRHHVPEHLDLKTEGMDLFFSPSAHPQDALHHVLRAGVVRAGRLAGGSQSAISLSQLSGPFVLMVPESHSVAHFVVTSDGKEEALVEVLDGRCIPEDMAPLRANGQLLLHNRLSTAVGYLVFPDPIPPPAERPADMQPPEHRRYPYLSGKRLITSQAFRELFQAESIPADAGLALRDLTVLFTDLKGSTEMYERIGDLRAFDLVRRHFETLLQSVTRRGGSVVKTIGDAVMASFAEPVSALAAALDMNQALRAVGREEELQLKIGLHAGPCIAVALNDRLDYFGRTVNIAARVQGVAGARQIVCTEPVHQAPGAPELVAEAGLTGLHDRVELKGIAEPVPVLRLE